MATWGDQTCQRFEATAVGFETRFSRLRVRPSNRYAIARHNLYNEVSGVYLCLFVAAYISDGPGVCFADRQTTGRDVDPSGGSRHRVTSATETRRYGGVCRTHRRPRSLSDNLRQRQEAGTTTVL